MSDILFREIGTRSDIHYRKIGIKSGILSRKICLRNGYNSYASMARPRPKCGQVQPPGQWHHPRSVVKYSGRSVTSKFVL